MKDGESITLVICQCFCLQFMFFTFPSKYHTIHFVHWFIRRHAGLRWVLFFQDTNGLLFKVQLTFFYEFIVWFWGKWMHLSPYLMLCVQAIPAALGVSATKQYHVNSLAVPRKAKEAIGGIAKLTHADGNSIVMQN